MISSFIASLLLISNVAGNSIPLSIDNDTSSYTITDTSFIDTNNDTYDEAYPLCDLSNFDKTSSYSKAVEGTIDTDMLYVDNDYFYFNVVTPSSVSINITSDRTDYFIYASVYCFQANGEENGYLLREESLITHDYNNTNNKNISLNLDPNTYYIVLSGNQPYNSYITIGYEIELSVNRLSSTYTIKAEDLIYGKQLSAAVWLNDCIPFDYDGMNGLSEKKYYDARRNDNKPEKLFNFIAANNVVNDHRVLFAKYYIWDTDLICDLYAYVSALSLSLDNVINQYDQEMKIKGIIVESATEATGFAINILTGGLAESASVIGRIGIKILSSSLKYGAKYVINDIVNLFFPQYEYNPREYKSHCEEIKRVLELYYGYFLVDSNKTESLKKCSEFILEFPVYYSIYKTNPLSIDYYESYSLACNVNEYPSVIHRGSDTKFTSTQEEYFGQIYGIKKGESIFNFSSKELANDISEQAVDCTSLRLDVDSSKSFYYFGYIAGFRFTAQSSREYHFYFYKKQDINISDPLIECFNTNPIGYSNNGRTSFYRSGYVTPDSDYSEEDYVGTYFSQYMNQNQTIYFRYVHPEVPNISEPTYSVVVTLNEKDNAYHVHSYDDHYGKSNKTMHKAYCSCGEFIFQPHAVLGSSKICIKCGETVDKGFIGMSLKNGNSYILENGIYVLSENDAKKSKKSLL